MILFTYLCGKIEAMRKLLAVIVIFILLMCSCSTTKLVEVPVEKIRTEYIHDTKIDSVFVKDSVDRWLKGDTLYIYKEHTKYKYLDRVDTVVRVDSIPKIVKIETVKEVEVNHIKWYQKILMWIGGIMSLILTGCIIYKVKLNNGNK